jgi:hypothetical protein
MEMWTTLRRLRLAHIPTAPTTTTLVPTHRQPEAFPNCKSLTYPIDTDQNFWYNIVAQTGSGNIEALVVAVV